MLDTPRTFDVADTLVGEFAELNEAHQAVVTARQQVQTLAPAREKYQRLQKPTIVYLYGRQNPLTNLA